MYVCQLCKPIGFEALWIWLALLTYGYWLFRGRVRYLPGLVLGVTPVTSHDAGSECTLFCLHRRGRIVPLQNRLQFSRCASAWCLLATRRQRQNPPALHQAPPSHRVVENVFSGSRAIRGSHLRWRSEKLLHTPQDPGPRATAAADPHF